MDETELSVENTSPQYTHAGQWQKLNQNLQEIKFTHDIQRTWYTWAQCLEKGISFTLILQTVYHGEMGVEPLIILMQIGCIC